MCMGHCWRAFRGTARNSRSTCVAHGSRHKPVRNAPHSNRHTLEVQQFVRKSTCNRTPDVYAFHSWTRFNTPVPTFRNLPVMEA